jgi:hypothetical protein
MEVKNSLTVNLQYAKKLKEKLQQIADIENPAGQRELVEIIVDSYFDKHKPPKPSKTPKEALQSDPNTFHVAYSDRIARYIDDMREYFADELDAPEDRDILKYFYQFTQKLKKKSILILRTPGAMPQLLESKAKDDLNSGRVRTVGEWLSRYLVSHFSKPQKEKKEDRWW